MSLHPEAHLFLTFTANGKWKEVVESIFDGQEPNRRPDIVTRVFNAKLENGYLGQENCFHFGSKTT